MSWILGGLYCGFLWLIFAKLKLFRLSLPVAVVAAAAGPSLIVALLFCAQYFHPYTGNARAFQSVVPITPQLREPGRVSEIVVQPNEPVSKGDVLFRVDPVPYQNSVDRLTSALKEAKQGEQVAKASVELAKAVLDRANGNLEFATADRDRKAALVESKAVSPREFEDSVKRFTEADAAVSQANASMTQAALSVELSQTKTEQIATQLADAQYDLSQVNVLAPGDGFVTNLQLVEGTLVGGAAGAVMSFVIDRDDASQGVVVAAFSEKNYLRIKQGQYAEVALHGYPGDIFTGRVMNAIDVSGAGQLSASGAIPSDLGPSGPTSFAVKIRLDKGDELRIPGGAQAFVAVYTEDIQVAGIPVMFLIRAQSWMHYLY